MEMEMEMEMERQFAGGNEMFSVSQDKVISVGRAAE
jgi:hypothetical protein